MRVKTCSKCKEEKSIDHFYPKKGTKDGYRSFCKVCCNKDCERWRANNKNRSLISEELIAIGTKTCTRCDKTKTLEEFPKHTQTRDGRDTQCKQCAIERSNKYYHDNTEIAIAKNKEYCKKNADKIKKRKREYRQKNAERCKDAHQRWRIKNADKYKECLRKRKAAIRRGEKGPLAQLKLYISNLITTAVHHSSYTKKSRTHEIIGCSYEELLSYLGPRPDGDYHIDHVCPNSLAQNEEEFLKLQYYWNLRWLTASDNFNKRDHWTQEGAELCSILLNREWLRPTINDTQETS